MTAQTLSPPDLEQRIRDWLSTHGYPLKMRTARVFQQCGLHTTIQEFYRDGHKHREIDVVGRLQSDLLEPLCAESPDKLLECQILAACNASTEEPWVAFSRDRSELNASEYHYKDRAANEVGRRLWDQAWPEITRDAPFLTSGERVAYSVRCAFENRDQDAAFAATSDIIDAAAKKARGAPRWQHYLRCRLIFPIVVIAAPLFECTLGSNNDTQLRSTDHISVYFRRRTLGDLFTIVDLMTEDYVATYCRHVKALFDVICSKYERDLREAFEYVTKQSKRLETPERDSD
jgi:hypothetical protein